MSRVGLVLIVAGLVVLGWVGWQFFGTDVTSNHAMKSEVAGVRQLWQKQDPQQNSQQNSTAAPTAKPTGSDPNGLGSDPNDIGDVIALMRIPRLGADWEKPVLAGTTTDVLAHGLGHYDDTVMPGKIGNFAVAGHRITHGSPFANLLNVRKGDLVYVETKTDIYTYVMDTSPRDLTVQDTAGWVLDAVPGKLTATPTRALITLTTCQDLFHSPDRSVGFGHLIKTQAK